MPGRSMITRCRPRTKSFDQIYQATGMVAVQADATIDEALELLALRAETLGQGMHETALQVLDRR